jgi:hypothetical protein
MYSKKLFASYKFVNRSKGFATFKFPISKTCGLLAVGAGTTFIVSNNVIHAESDQEQSKGLTYRDKVLIFTLCASTFVGFNIIAYVISHFKTKF